ncbi:MAG: lytic murein transglycosylase B [Gammaproteobacteria bacterium]|nr:lytic murein transglycosylase B [Gammaproteobacteria bacterium]
MHPIRTTAIHTALLLLLSVLSNGCANTPKAAPTSDTLAAAPAAVVVAPVASAQRNYASHPQAAQFIADMAARHQLPPAEVTALLADAKPQQSILDAMSRPAEAKPWRDYRPIFLTRERINGGVAFWNTNAQILADAQQHFGVDSRVVVAIVGVETRYGGNTGKYRVLDALATLGFDYPKRGEFFRGELEQFLLLTREEHVDARTAKGSYAGAMGQGQFIPSSYRAYAVDFDGDGKRDLWNSERDVLGSVANYFKEHGWQQGAPVVARAQVRGTAYKALLDKGLKPHMPASDLAKYGVHTESPIAPNTPVALVELDGADGLEQWVVFNNFYVITRYNRSPLYAMAVHQLSNEIAATRASAQR